MSHPYPCLNKLMTAIAKDGGVDLDPDWIYRTKKQTLQALEKTASKLTKTEAAFMKGFPDAKNIKLNVALAQLEDYLVACFGYPPVGDE